MIKSRLDIGVLFRKLSALPDNVYLTQLDLKEETMLISGIVVGKPNEVSGALDELVAALQEDISSDASLLSKKLVSNKTDAVEFKIKGSVSSGGKSDFQSKGDAAPGGKAKPKAKTKTKSAAGGKAR